jgi:hypothetical protein
LSDPDRNFSGFSNVAILAPVGAYIGRVKRGVEGAMALSCDKGTAVEVMFVLEEKWAQDKSYVEAITNLRTAFLDEAAYAAIYKTYSCSFSTLDFENEDACTGYMIEKLASLFKRKGPSVAYIDTTSGSMEWVISCVTVTEFFHSTYLYFVKPRGKMRFTDFSLEEIHDDGIHFEIVKRSSQARELSNWLTPGSENWTIFRDIFKLATESSKQTGKPPYESAVEIGHLLQDLSSIKRWRSKSEGEKKRGLSKYLTAIERYGLFARRGKNYLQMTPRGVALGRGLFPEILSG